MDYGNTKTPSMYCRLGSATLSQLAFTREGNPNFPWDPIGTIAVKKKKKSKEKKVNKSTSIWCTLQSLTLTIDFQPVVVIQSATWHGRISKDASRKWNHHQTFEVNHFTSLYASNLVTTLHLDNSGQLLACKKEKGADRQRGRQKQEENKKERQREIKNMRER